MKSKILNKKKNIKKNYLYNVLYRIISLITPLITTPYVSRILGAEGIGIYSYTLAVSTYFTLLATMGTSSYGQREISYYQDDIETRSLEFWNIELFSCISVFIALIVYIIFIMHYPMYRILYLILSINILSVAFDISWFFQGMEEFGKIVLRNIFFKILTLIYIFIFVKSRTDLYIYVFGITIFNFISSISLWTYLPKYIIKIKLKKLNPLKKIIPIWSLFIPTIAISIYTVLDKTMIGWFSNNPLENGYYEQATTIVKFVLTFVTALGNVMIPRIGFCYEKGEYEVIQKYMYHSYNFVWFLGCPLCAGLIATADNFIPWFLGFDFIEAIPILQILSFLLIAIGINNVTGMQYLIPTKKQHIFTLTVILGAISNFILNLYMIPSWGARGAALTSVIAEFIIAGTQIIIIRKVLNPIKIIYLTWRYVISSMIMFLGVNYISSIIFPSIFNSLFLAFVGGIIYFLMLIVLKERFILGYIKFYLKI